MAEPKLPKWALYESACYLQKEGLVFGAGPLYHPPAITRVTNAHQVTSNFKGFASNYYSFVVFGGKLGEIVPEERYTLLRDAAPTLKTGGYLTFIVPTKNFDLEAIRATIGEFRHWTEKTSFIKDDVLFAIFKAGSTGRHGVDIPKPKPQVKRACICRLGAIGDMIMVTPLIETLKKDGYHVTVNTSPYSADVLENNPNVDNILIQERNIIPNNELGPYWNHWKPRYDKYINLSESIEGGLLKVEGRRAYFTTRDWRCKTCDANYYDKTLELGGYPEVTGLNGKIYLTAKEKSAAHRTLAPFRDKFRIGVALVGSSHHKSYPLMGPTISRFLDQHPDATVVLLGDESASRVTFVHPQVYDFTGQTTLRQLFALTHALDCIVGPETAITNAAACFDTPNIVLMSHSSTHNLTKYWNNCYPIVPKDCECYPCHQLHYTFDSCPIVKLCDDITDEVVAAGPACTISGIDAHDILEALEKVYEKHQEKAHQEKAA